MTHRTLVLFVRAPQLGSGKRRSREPLLVRAMRALAETDSVAFAARSEELAYLANVLVAGDSIEGRRYRPAEAEIDIVGMRHDDQDSFDLIVIDHESTLRRVSRLRHETT